MCFNKSRQYEEKSFHFSLQIPVTAHLFHFPCLPCAVSVREKTLSNQTPRIWCGLGNCDNSVLHNSSRHSRDGHSFKSLNPLWLFASGKDLRAEQMTQAGVKTSLLPLWKRRTPQFVKGQNPWQIGQLFQVQLISVLLPEPLIVGDRGPSLLFHTVHTTGQYWETPLHWMCFKYIGNQNTNLMFKPKYYNCFWTVFFATNSILSVCSGCQRLGFGCMHRVHFGNHELRHISPVCTTAPKTTTRIWKLKSRCGF